MNDPFLFGDALLTLLKTYGLLVVGIFLIIYFVPLGLWFSARLSGVDISLVQLIFMRWRRVPPGLIVYSMINLHKAEIKLSRDQLEAHFLAGGRVTNVVNSLIVAKMEGVDLTFDQASALDLAGQDVFELVKYGQVTVALDELQEKQNWNHSPSSVEIGDEGTILVNDGAVVTAKINGKKVRVHLSSDFLKEAISVKVHAIDGPKITVKPNSKPHE